MLFRSDFEVEGAHMSTRRRSRVLRALLWRDIDDLKEESCMEKSMIRKSVTQAYTYVV